jgi:hypothetical protein
MTDDPFWNGVAVLYWWFVFVPMLAVATAILVFTFSVSEIITVS